MRYAATEAPPETIAVLEIRLLPGRASIRASAFFAGGSLGTLEAKRWVVKVLEIGAIDRAETTGRSLATPGKC